MPLDQSRIIEQAKFTHSSLSKVFQKQTKTVEQEGMKKVEALKALKPGKNKEDIKSIERIFSKRHENYWN